MQKILFAIGNSKIEELLEKRLGDNFRTVGTSTYREGILANIEKSNPDIVIIREGLKGNQNISEIIYNIRRFHEDVRIIFLTGTREPGDELLAILVNMQVFDILADSRIPTEKLLNLIKNPNTYQQVAHYQPKFILDDKSKRVLFEPPSVTQTVQKVEKVVYVEKPTEQLPQTDEQKSRKGRGFFGKKNTEDNDVVTVTPEPEPEPTKKPKFGRKNAPDEAVSLKEQKAKEKELEKQRVREETARKKEAERIRKEEQERARQEAEQNALAEAERNRQLELELKTLELQKQLDDLAKNKEAERFLNRELPAHGKQKIITFMGSEHGVGNTQVALNTSIQLANNGFKTIYIELKEKPSTVDYLYRLHRNIDTGLEIALYSLESQDYRAVNKSIVRMKDVIDRTSESDLMLDVYKQFPKNLDFLFFSPTYTSEDNELVVDNPQGLQQLCWHLLVEAGYHYVILDADIEKSNPYSEVALGFSSKVFYTLTQDICHIGNSVRHVANISKSINIKDKLYYVVNKFDESDMTRTGISDWLKTDVKITIPNANKEFINANYIGQPVLLNTKQKDLKRAFNEIAQTIQTM